MCVSDAREIEAARIETRAQLSGFGKACRLAHDLAMMRAAFARQQWQQREHAGVDAAAERQRRQRMRAPTERAHDMSEARDRFEGRIERRPADIVVDDVKALTASVFGHILLDSG